MSETRFIVILMIFIYRFRPAAYMIAQPPPTSLQAATVISSNQTHQQPEMIPRADLIAQSQHLNINHSTLVQTVPPTVITTSTVPTASLPTSLLSPNALIPFPIAAANSIHPTAVVVATTDSVSTTATVATSYPPSVLATSFPPNSVFATPSPTHYLPLEEFKLKELVRGQMYVKN